MDLSRKYVIPALGILGALLGILTVYNTQKTNPVPPILFLPAQSPYAHAIAGTGIIEASSRNIAVGSAFNQIVTKIFVVEGQSVKAGDPLFQLDTRGFDAQLTLAKAQYQLALANLADKKTQYSFYKRLRDSRAVSQQLLQQARFAYLEAIKSVKVQKAEIGVAQTNIELSTITAPIDGEILRLNIHLGELAPIMPIASPQSLWQTESEGVLLLMGSVEPLQIRIDIDESDAWRFTKDRPATAFVRGNSRINFPLQFVRVEPYIVPKTSFTGATTERVDTRVLQVLYSFEKSDLPVYPGQVLDIFIESKPNESPFVK